MSLFCVFPAYVCMRKQIIQYIKQLKQIEDTLAIYSHDMIFATDASARFNADSAFIKTFVRGLKTEHSFSYPFDSLKSVSKIYAPDSSFRIFSWQIERDESYFRQFGAIQLNTKDGSLKLFPCMIKVTMQQILLIPYAQTKTGSALFIIIS